MRKFEKSNILIHRMKMNLFTANRSGREMTGQTENFYKTFHKIATLCAGRRNQTDNGCCWTGQFDPNTGTIVSSFGKNPKCFPTAV